MEVCPKCQRPECIGDCGLFTIEEKMEFLNKRFIDHNKDNIGRERVHMVMLEKNPRPLLKIGSYTQKSKKKARWVLKK